TFDKEINLSNNIPLSFQPQIAVSDNDNNVYVVWTKIHSYKIQNKQQQPSRYDIIFRKSIDRGETFDGKGISLANNSSGFSDDLLLATSGTNVYALWVNGTIVSGESTFITDIVFAKSLDNGNKFDKLVNNVSNSTGWSFGPQMAVLGSNVYVVWNENPHEKKGDIMFRRSNNYGTTFENKITDLSNGTEGDSFDQKIVAVQSKNNVNDVYVVWNEYATNGNEEIRLGRSTDGGNTFDNSTNLTSNNNNGNNQLAQHPQIALSKIDNNTNVYVAWDANTTANNEEIFLRKITTTIPSLYGGNKSAIVLGSNTTISENANKSVGKDIGILAATTITTITTTAPAAAATNIAIIRPTFTAAAYDNAFYLFYKLNANATIGSNITRHVGLLSNTITTNNNTLSEAASRVSSEAAIDYLVDHIKWLMPKSNITVLSDEDAHNGYIFKKEGGGNSSNTNSNNNQNAYDVVILGHQEYVTQKEYDNLKKFVTNGGILFLMDGNTFYAEVKYDDKTKTITLAKGHNWEFNGKSAWRSIGERWTKETSQWIGSNYLCYSCRIIFLNNPFEYQHREEQYMTNPKDKILLDYNASVIGPHSTDDIDTTNNSTMAYHSNVTNAPPQNNNNNKTTKMEIATYELDYGKGKVIALGIYADDIIINYRFNKFLDSLLLRYSLKDKTQ
ncbi:MAG TPA: N,N-dimethylformamidase beta subunit family domain-containing protein, partial [Nitrososphaeraceae archaeon]|nr:N,N-dimethylformamidase beta subunit family domain-containing protein [Nitrososphaeraceae archaeon]